MNKKELLWIISRGELKKVIIIGVCIPKKHMVTHWELLFITTLNTGYNYNNTDKVNGRTKYSSIEKAYLAMRNMGYKGIFELQMIN